MPTLIEKAQLRVLATLATKIDDCYLGDGTALSLFYFHHRDSVDLDFYIREFSRVRIKKIVGLISLSIKKRLALKVQNLNSKMVKICVYSLPLNKNKVLKIDFIEDYGRLINPPRLINGIKVLSLEDIYLRKLYAAVGTSFESDVVGRKGLWGGRQEAKDFFDLYCLSHIFMELSDFSFKYGNQLMRESIIRWFRTYNRLEMKTGLLELKLKKSFTYTEMERHFKREIDRILEREVEFA